MARAVYVRGTPYCYELSVRTHTFLGKDWAESKSSKGRGFYNLGQSVRIFSYRLTWVPAAGPWLNRPDLKGRQLAGVKLVLWPLYDMDAQIGTTSEIACSKDWRREIGGLPGKQGDLACASPIDRIYCLQYDDPYGVVDPLTVEDFAGNVDIPKEYGFSNQITCSNPTDESCKAETTYPMGSGRIAPYASSWAGGVCMHDPSWNQLIGSQWTVVTKISSQTCHQMWALADWSKGGPAGAKELWCKDYFKVILTADSKDNLGGNAGGAKPSDNCVNVGEGGSKCRNNVRADYSAI